MLVFFKVIFTEVNTGIFKSHKLLSLTKAYVLIEVHNKNSGKLMKKMIIGLAVLSSVSAFADCNYN